MKNTRCVSVARWLAACAVCLCLPALAALSQDHRATDLAGDAAIVRAGLDELYPSLDRFGQRKAVVKALAELDAIASHTNDPDAFYRAVAAVAAATRDEHVIPFPSQSFRTARRENRTMLPYTLLWKDGVPFVRAVADPAHSSLVGQEVVRFDGEDAARVAQTLRATIPSDGTSQTFALRHLQDFTPTQNENYFDLNYPIWFGARDAYTLTTRDARGALIETRLSALNWEAFSAFYSARLPRKAPMSFAWIAKEIGYLSVLSFHDWYYEEHALDPNVFLERVFDDMRQRPGASLILDLRRNEGGGDISSTLLDHVMPGPFREYDTVLTQFVGQPGAARFCENAGDVAFNPQWAERRADGLYQLRPEFRGLITGANTRSPRPDAFGGKLIVLISGATGSAAAKVAAVLDREDRATFVGEETGGAAAGATAYGYCTLLLPASQIKLTIPLIRFERATATPYGRGVMPDFAVDAGATPPLIEEDRVLQKAVQVVRASED